MSFKNGMAKSAISAAWLGFMPTPPTSVSMMPMRVISTMENRRRSFPPRGCFR